jgi:hypothetical protein
MAASKGSPKPECFTQGHREQLKGLVGKKCNCQSVWSLFILLTVALSLFLVSENRFPDEGQDHKLVQRLPNKKSGFNFPFSANQIVRKPLDHFTAVERAAESLGQGGAVGGCGLVWRGSGLDS